MAHMAIRSTRASRCSSPRRRRTPEKMFSSCKDMAARRFLRWPCSAASTSARALPSRVSSPSAHSSTIKSTSLRRKRWPISSMQRRPPVFARQRAAWSANSHARSTRSSTDWWSSVCSSKRRSIFRRRTSTSSMPRMSPGRSSGYSIRSKACSGVPVRGACCSRASKLS